MDRRGGIRRFAVGGVFAAGLLASTLLLISCAASKPQDASAPPPGASRADSYIDRSDLYAVGIPDATRFGTEGAGAVDVREAGGGSQILDELKLGLAFEHSDTEEAPADRPDGSNARFGAAVVSADLNADGYDDLVVGAPSYPTSTVPAHVYLMFGTPLGITSTGLQTLTGPAGESFGSALAVTFRNDGGSTADQLDLWVGAPGHDVDGKADAGAVYRYEVDLAGRATPMATLTQGTAPLTGAAESGDRFGEVLGRGLVGAAVGVPREDVGPVTDAGSVVYLWPLQDGTLTARTVSQNTAGVPGSAEPGDRFGAAVSRGAVGVPGEDVGKLKEAGLVQLFRTFAAKPRTPAPGLSLTQNSEAVPGVAEAGDRFGASVQSGGGLCAEQQSLGIGSPGEDVGSVRDAGSVTVTARPYQARGCPATVLVQGRNLPGTSEPGDQLGATLATVCGCRGKTREGNIGSLLLGVPGEDVVPADDPRGGTAKNAGRVLLWNTNVVSTLGSLEGDFQRPQYGQVLGDQT